MNVFVAGNQGQLGKDVTVVLNAAHDVRGMDLPELDITDPHSIQQGIGTWPEAIVNCAAYTNVDGCESDENTAWAANAEGPALLANHAVTQGAVLVHISTDYVFDGTKPVPNAYRETDPVGPVSAYGRTKLGGETAIQESGCTFAIARTSWLYGAHGRNFLKTMLRLALTKPETTIKVINDQYGCPTWSYRLAVQIEAILATQTRGILHASGEGFCTWYELATYFLEKMRVAHRVIPCTTEEYPTPARRPANSILENTNLSAQGINRMQDWKEDIDQFIAKYHDALIEDAQETGS